MPKRVVGGKLVLRDVKVGEFPDIRGGEAEKPRVVGKTGRATLETEGGRAAVLEWTTNAGRVDDVTTYHAALLVDSVRIRGVDYSAIERRRWFRTRIPKGWHENVIDPNTGENRHNELNLGTVTDFEDFCRKVAKHWNITYQQEETLL